MQTPPPHTPLPAGSLRQVGRSASLLSDGMRACLYLMMPKNQVYEEVFWRLMDAPTVPDGEVTTVDQTIFEAAMQNEHLKALSSDCVATRTYHSQKLQELKKDEDGGTGLPKSFPKDARTRIRKQRKERAAQRKS